MAEPVLLNNVDHGDLRVRLDRGAAYGDAVAQVTVFATEFEALQREYPIVFRRDDGGRFRAVALLGLEARENLFLDGERWDARTIPALLQRGPFSIGVPGGGQVGEPMIHVDLANARINYADGVRVFAEHGGNSDYLDHVGGVLRAIYVGDQVNDAMFAAWKAAGLIEPVTLRIEVDEGRRFDVPDCHTIAQDRLRGLDAAALSVLHRDDFLRPAIWAASSLGNIAALVDRKRRRDAAR